MESNLALGIVDAQQLGNLVNLDIGFWMDIGSGLRGKIGAGCWTLKIKVKVHVKLD